MIHIRRKALSLASVLATAALLAACASTPQAAEPEETAGPIKDTLTFSYSNAVQQLEKVPLHFALENLTADGITTKETFHQTGDEAVQAVARGESDFGTANAPTVFAAIKKGVPIKAIMTAYHPAYLLVAPVDVKNAGDLDGMRVGIQSQVSATTLYTNFALAEYPEAKPEILIVPGSAARVQAIIAGQLDASVVQFADWMTLNEQAPDRFHVIYDVARENSGIIDSVIFTSTATMESDPAYVETFLAALQDQYVATYADEDQLADDIEAILPDTTADRAAELAKTAIEDKIWPVDGGFDNDTIKLTLDALSKAGLLTADTLPTAKECCTAQFVKK
jgi:NitT/TauT family transport system substrate-binding protein